MSPSRPFALVEVAIRIDQKLLIWLGLMLGECWNPVRLQNATLLERKTQTPGKSNIS